MPVPVPVQLYFDYSCTDSRGHRGAQRRGCLLKGKVQDECSDMDVTAFVDDTTCLLQGGTTSSLPADYTCTTKRAICKDGCNADGVPDAQGDGVLTRGVRRGVGTIRPKTSWGFHRSLHPEGRVLHIKYLGGYTGLSCQHCVARWGWVWGSCVSWSCVSRTASVCRCRTHHVRLDYKESRR